MMTIDQNLRTRLETIFAPLNKKSAGAFPLPASLSAELEKALPRRDSVTTVSVPPGIASMFATAVEIWMRGVHSFLVSASLTEASPIWASVSGYYSSHYSIRALAHLLGYFHLFRRKQIVHLELKGGKHFCSFNRPQRGRDREHRFYWEMVKFDPHFNSDPLFMMNTAEDDASDVGHRDRANYADHVCQFPNFRALDKETLKRRVHFISQIHFSTPPIPMRSRFPDVESVQAIAYHRLVRFREFLDQILGGGNRFWNVYRSPKWAREITDFQLTEQGGLSSLAG